MRDRALVHVAGPDGAGKTSLIERLRNSNRSELLMVARGVLDDALTREEEGAASTDDELNRYREAGASNVVRYLFPPAERGTDAFFCSDFMTDYSEGVLIEGDSPLGFSPDLTVFVAPPVHEGEPLLRRVTVDRSAAQDRQLEQLRALVGSPDGGAGFLRAMIESEFDRSLPVPDSAMEHARQSLAEVLERTELEGPPSPDERWGLAEGFAGIERAQVVVVNVRSPAERGRGEAMLPELARLRKDREVFDDVIGWRENRLPITAGVADLADPKDNGLKRILTRIKRAFASRR